MHLSDVKPAYLAAVYLFVSGESIPPRMDASYNNISCEYTGEADLHPFAFRTHTHAMGRVVSAYFKHGGKWEQIGKRNPQWPQLFQRSPTGLVIRKGDFMAAMCRFDSHDKEDETPMGSVRFFITDDHRAVALVTYVDLIRPIKIPGCRRSTFRFAITLPTDSLR